jgi:uncharacterized protein YdeI (YjbR/CyaY-like superfamily)
MGTRDPRIDAYIAKSAEFARPILVHLREVVHAACPDVNECMKWSFPHFEHQGVLCSMAGFKRHCSMGFWKNALLVESADAKTAKALDKLGRITEVDDLPKDAELTRLIKKAARLNEDGVKLPKKPQSKKPKALEVPDYFLAALKKNKKALAAFEKFSPSHKKEYVEWIVEAKREETRTSRIAQAIEWMAEGKSRHWKYVRK